MEIIIDSAEYFVLDMRTRMPFRYGIATLEALPHVMLELKVRVEGESTSGIAAEGLAPKWFVKNPVQPFDEELREMIAVLSTAADIACGLGVSSSPFDCWKKLNMSVRSALAGTPPLLVSLGVSMVERAVIDACCRQGNMPFHRFLYENTAGIDLGATYPELKGSQPADWLPETPLQSMIVRHTVGLSDPLRQHEVSSEDRVHDGLPQSLDEVVERYGVSYAKVKVSGNLGRDEARLSDVLGILEDRWGTEFRFTLDGNEYFREEEQLIRYCASLFGLTAFRRHVDRLLFFEQPFHRSVALGTDLNAVRAELPVPFIIDESDASPEALRTGLRLGYSGTSHKNCKGVFKSVANACLLAKLNAESSEGGYVLSSEDLATVGPVALLQDLAVISALGISHSERNGHHYFRGLSMFPESTQSAVLVSHSSLYRPHPGGYPTLAMDGGRISMESINSAPFGYGFDMEPAILGSLDAWDLRFYSA